MCWDPFSILLGLFFCFVVVLCIGNNVIEYLDERKARRESKK
jgi:hypothetical protein